MYKYSSYGNYYKNRPKKKEAKALQEYLKNLPFVEIAAEKPRYNIKTENAIQKVKEGKVAAANLTELRRLMCT